MPPGDLPPTAAEVAGIADPELRRQCVGLRRRYREHRGVVAARLQHQPPPF